MSPRTGLGVLECTVLAALAELGAGPDNRCRPTSRVLDHLELEHSIGAAYAYLVMQNLVAPWKLHLPLLEGYGNWGSPGDDAAADARYTEVRLSRIGALALAAERGEIAPVPLGLIEGNLYRDGPVPPFDPRRILAALRDGSSDAGPPASPTGGTVEGSITRLLAGERVRLHWGCTIVSGPGRLVITEYPLGINPDEVARAIASAVGHARGPDVASPAAPASILALRDESRDDRQGLVLILKPDADPATVRRWLRSLWPVRIAVDCKLPAPMDRLLGDWDAGDGSGLDALETLL